MSNKLTIKEEMRAIDQRDVGWWDTLTEEEQKKISPWLLMRYTSACDTNHDAIRDHYLTMTNELVNVQFNTLRHHVQLQHRLMQVVGIGKSQYHPWIAPGKRQKKKSKSHVTSMHTERRQINVQNACRSQESNKR